MCAIGHPYVSRDPVGFAAATIRLPHFPDREAYWDLGDDRLWMRNCPVCKSTLYIPVAK